MSKQLQKKLQIKKVFFDLYKQLYGKGRVFLDYLVSKKKDLDKTINKQAKTLVRSLIVKSKKHNQSLVLKNHNDIYLYQASRNYELFNPNLLKIVSSLLVFILFAFIALASVIKIKEAAIASGEITPPKNIVNLEHFDGGVVSKIYFFEGDRVKQGDVLLILDGIGAQEDLDKYLTKNISLKLQAERLYSLINHTKPRFSEYTKDKKLLHEQEKIRKSMVEAAQTEKLVIQKKLNQEEFSMQSLLAKKEHFVKQIQIAQQILSMYQQLEVKGHAPKIKLLEEQERLDSLMGEQDTLLFEIQKTAKVIQEYQSKLLSYDATQESTMHLQLEKIKQEIAENDENIIKLKQKAERRNLRSPVSGIINVSYVGDIGESIYPNKKLFEIIPLNARLIATLHISPNDIGHVKVGDRVWVKISAYDYIKYGFIEGTLSHISLGTYNDADNREGPYYKGRVRLEHNYVELKGKKKYLMPGMQIKAEIITGERTILEYLLKPIYRSLDGGLMER